MSITDGEVEGVRNQVTNEVEVVDVIIRWAKKVRAVQKGPNRPMTRMHTSRNYHYSTHHKLIQIPHHATIITQHHKLIQIPHPANTRGEGGT